MSKTLTYDMNGKDITCMKQYDILLYPCDECEREDCEERDKYDSRVGKANFSRRKRLQNR
jgi:hypothetical protein